MTPARLLVVVLAASYVASAWAPCPPPAGAREPGAETASHPSAHPAGTRPTDEGPPLGIRAPCRCGCKERSSSAREGGRLGFALARALPPDEAHAPGARPAAGTPLPPRAPDLGIDPVPIEPPPLPLPVRARSVRARPPLLGDQLMQCATRAFLVSCLALQAASASADPSGDASFASRPDSHAPIGVMGEHMHAAGEWMVSYRYGRVRMEGNRDGTSGVDEQQVLEDFMVSPTDMDMEMHMFGLMVAPTDWVTLMAMLPWVQLSMNHVTRMDTSFRTETDGIGDFRTSGLFRLWEDETNHLHLNFGLSFPTGDIRLKDATPADPNSTLPFPMQIGSGTWDLLPGLTYVGHSDRFSWGSQVLGTVRLGENSAGWAASDRVDFTAWVGHPWTSWLSTSARVAVHWWSNYRGDENRPPPPPSVPTARPDLRGGQSVELLGGFNLLVPLGRFLGKNRFAVEVGGPVYQSLDGPQLETDWRLVVGWQKAF